ncbi:ABC transporter ATP-binding protein [Clostridium thailandense]|uniref:ABC transporter ATP-binding protein n=1 Tax=Clostridium thailandense TaxID=2794346 RepID=UPI0039891E21
MGKLASLLKLKPFIKKYWMIFGIGAFGIILSSLAATPVPYIIGYLMDKIFLSKKSYNELYLYIAVIAGLYIFKYIISFLSKYIFAKINNLVVNELRYSVMAKVIDLPMNYLSNTEKGYVQSRISECSSIGSIFSPSIISVFLSIIDALLALVTMFAINYKLAFVVLLLAPVFFFSAKNSAKNFMKNTMEAMESNAVLNGECFEIISGIEDIKILNGKETHLKKFKDKLDELIKISIKQSKSIVMFMENIGLINNFGSLLILLIAGLLILKGQFTVGLYTSFSLYIGTVFGSTQGLATIGTTIKPACLSIERIYELLDMKEENYGRNKELKENIKLLKFENVSFKYNDDKKVLDSLSFQMKKGDKVLIKGENGSGKSTLIKLLLGLYNQTEGKILYNNIDSMEINIKDLRERIGIVCQNIFLFKGTVLDNILYGQTNKKREDVEKIIKELHLQEYMNRLPKGIDTEIIQNTAGVSGGQAQIIAFIRAMVSEKDMLILDEPISNVDAETREVVLNILRNTSFSGILIIVSHLVEGMDFIDKVVEI